MVSEGQEDTIACTTFLKYLFNAFLILTRENPRNRFVKMNTIPENRLMLRIDGICYDVSNLITRPPRKSLYPTLCSLPQAYKMEIPRGQHSQSAVECIPNSMPSRGAFEASSCYGGTCFANTESSQGLSVTWQGPQQTMDYIQVAPNLRLRLKGSIDTTLAIKERRIARHVCMNCRMTIGCIDSAHYVICPYCRCVLPTGLESFNNNNSNSYQEQFAVYGPYLQ